MMNYLPPDTILLPENLSTVVYSELISLLSENDAWKIVAEAFEIFSCHDIKNFSLNSHPAEKLIFELGSRLCTIEVLCEILKKCHLYNVFILFKEYEPIHIVQQPSDAAEQLFIVRGTQLSLTCKAIGYPPPVYQWYHDNKKLNEQKNSTLVVENFDLNDEGEYYCQVYQEEYKSLLSTYVNVLLAPEKPFIIKQPPFLLTCEIGAEVVLNVVAKGHPDLKYQWFKGNTQLDSCTNSKLVLSVEEKNENKAYRCFIYNSVGEIWSDESKIIVCKTPHPEPSTKIALLIGNQFYDNLDYLHTPEEDVKILSNLLQDLGFYTIALENLRLVEMRNIVKYLTKILPKDAYVLFYFSGHGFEMHDKFILPVDVPGPRDYLQIHCLSERELLKAILSTQPKLCLVLLDMCLKAPHPLNQKIYNERITLYEFEVDNNLIQAYSTTSNLNAYEARAHKNGLYTEILKEYLINKNNLPIVEILRCIAKDIMKICPMQKPFFGTNVVQDFRFTDNCLNNTELREKIESLSFIPPKIVLDFKKINFKTSVNFRPYMGVFLNTLEICFSASDNYEIGCETFGEELSFELQRVNSDIVLKVMNIQRLLSNKILTFTLSKKNVEIVDSAVCNIGKPLIAAIDLCLKNVKNYDFYYAKEKDNASICF